jgi:hypothetical protein
MSEPERDIRMKLDDILKYGPDRSIIAIEESIEAIHAQLTPDTDGALSADAAPLVRMIHRVADDRLLRPSPSTGQPAGNQQPK